MADALASGLAASLATAMHYVTLPPAPAPAPATDAAPTPNLNAPAYVSPAVSFDPITDIVFLTFRNAESGKITEQIPPSEVLSRYRMADETGIPNPVLPRLTTPNDLAGTAIAPPSGKPAPPPPDAAPAPRASSTSSPTPGSTSSPTPGTFA